MLRLNLSRLFGSCAGTSDIVPGICCFGLDLSGLLLILLFGDMYLWPGQGSLLLWDLELLAALLDVCRCAG